MKLTERRAISFVEVMVTMILVAVAVLPLLRSIGSTGRSVYSMGKHQLSALIARSVLDRLLAMPFVECRDKCRELGDETPVIADTEFSNLATKIALDEREYKGITFRVNVTDASSAEEQDLLFVVEVTVSWPVQNSEEKREISFKAIKYETRI